MISLMIAPMKPMTKLALLDRLPLQGQTPYLCLGILHRQCDRFLTGRPDAGSDPIVTAEDNSNLTGLIPCFL
jgi:hypothetical protein